MRVAFTLIGFEGWTGGSQYQRHLFSTMASARRNLLQPILFVGQKVSQGEIDPFRSYVSEIVVDPCFDKWTPSWAARQLLTMVAQRDSRTEKVFRKHRVDVVFFSGFFGARFSVPVVNWIADFQHARMPKMFSARERLMRNFVFRMLAQSAKRLILNSESVKRDFEAFLPAYVDRVDVLRFCAQIPLEIYEATPYKELHPYDIPEKFFHLPNQFWKHKNHYAVIRALETLKDRGRKVCVVCTGKEQDYRHPDHLDFIKKEISKRGVADQIFLKGLVPVRHLYLFMRQSISVLNPSLFEGWSTSVEEARSLGKPTLLSAIPAHREQNPPGGIYFDPRDPEDLADKMWSIWTDRDAGPDVETERKAIVEMEKRAAAFAEGFANILRKALA